MIKKIVKNLDDLKLMYETLKPLKMLGCDVETTSLELDKMELLGVGIGSNQKMFYVPWDYYEELKNEDIVKVFNVLFKKPIIFHNAKFDLKVLDKFGFKVPKEVHDSMIMSWMCDETTPNGLKHLAKNILKRDEVVEFKDVERMMKAERKAYDDNLKNKSGTLFETDKEPEPFKYSESLTQDIGHYCMDDVRNTCDLYVIFKKQLVEEKIWAAYTRLEKPIVQVLNRMETRGVKIDTVWLRQKRDEAEEILEILKKKMYAVVGKDPATFNLNSPMQLEALLFDELGYKPIKMTNSGKRSTNTESLQQIIKNEKLTEDDFVPMLLQFRDMDKLHNTYLVGLLDQAGKDGIIHASFLQHGTRTGRLSCREPNLQNIPARHDDWDVRAAFIPRDGHKFIISDYSQVELRVLAHFSQDENMVNAFRSGADIHATTMEVAGIEERRVAKAINFGLVYGMGPRRLAEQLNITEAEASDYIDRWFRGYPKIKPFISSVQWFAKKNGYIPMLTGRRRRFLDQGSRSWWGEVQRESINTKIQGSAADIMKIAMLKLDKNLRQFNAYQLIQVHDEVIIEVPDEHVDEAKKVVQETMEGAVELSVPLKSEPEIADHWIKG